MKMKRVALDSSSNGDGKNKSRLESLMQDYQELHKEVESSRSKLENMKQRKATLRAEVRFLRRRYKYLINSKSMTQERGKELVQQHDVEEQRKKIVNVQILNMKEAALRAFPPVFRPNHKIKEYTRNEISLQNKILRFDQRKKIVNVQIPNMKEAALRAFPPVFRPNYKRKECTRNEISLQNKIPRFDPNHKGKHHSGKNATRFYPTVSNLNPKGRSYKGKEVVSRQTPVTMIDLSKHENTYNGNSLAAMHTYNGNSLAAMHTPASVLDLTRVEATLSSKQATDKSRAPIFDLNQRLVDEEEYQDNCEMVKQDKLSDLQLSLCRNVGDSSSHVVKRNISWQDPVALRV